jgi:hypothetical protein
MNRFDPRHGGAGTTSAVATPATLAAAQARCAIMPTRAAAGPQEDRVSHRSAVPRAARFAAMAEVVLRVRLMGGDHLDVTYDDADAVDVDDVVDRAVSALAEDSGVLRTQHGGRLLVLYGRGVAALEVAPRGAVL